MRLPKISSPGPRRALLFLIGALVFYPPEPSNRNLREIIRFCKGTSRRYRRR
jgi:hypothetical protein